MISPVFELVKVAALAAFLGLLMAVWLEPIYASLVGLAAFWLLLARIT